MTGSGDQNNGGTPAESLTRVRFTNLSKLMFPEAGITKQEVIAYYIRMAPRMLPFLAKRPVTMHRYPEGVGGEDFYEKDAPQGTPGYVDIFPHWSDTAGREVRFVVCNNLDTLIWLANLASLEIHVTLSTSERYDSPDFLLFDIDPEPPLTLDAVIEVAHIVRGHLADRGLRPYVKTSGKKGLHIIVPLVSGHRFGEVRDYVHDLGKEIARDIPWVVSEFPRSRDAGTVFVDYLQNAHGKTMAAPWSLRATPGANVSLPLAWDALRPGLRSEDFNIRTVLPGSVDPWRGILDDRQTIGK